MAGVFPLRGGVERLTEAAQRPFYALLAGAPAYQALFRAGKIEKRP